MTTRVVGGGWKRGRQVNAWNKAIIFPRGNVRMVFLRRVEEYVGLRIVHFLWWQLIIVVESSTLEPSNRLRFYLQFIAYSMSSEETLPCYGRPGWKQFCQRWFVMTQIHPVIHSNTDPSSSTTWLHSIKSQSGSEMGDIIFLHLIIHSILAKTSKTKCDYWVLSRSPP